MKRLLSILCIKVATILIIACNRHVIKGNGNVVTQQREVVQFDRLLIGDDFVVTLSKSSSAPALQVVTDDNVQPYVITQTDDNQLSVMIKPEYRVEPSQPIEVVINSEQLKEIELNDKAQLTAGNLSGDALTFKASGEATAILQGKVDQLSYFLNGNAQLNAKNLAGESVTVNIEGDAKVSVDVEKKLDIYINGSGEVTYFGEPPIINQEIYGGGQLVKGDQ